MRALIGLILIFGCSLLLSQSHEIADKAFQAFQQGNFKEAAEHYKEADEALPGNPVLLYNRAASAYRLEQWQECIELLIEASRITEDSSLMADIIFARGNARVQLARAAAETDIKKGIEELSKAIGIYRELLIRQPDHADGRQNLMVVKTLMKVFLDQLKQQEQQKQEEEKNKEPTIPERIKELLQRQLQEQGIAGITGKYPQLTSDVKALNTLAQTMLKAVQDGAWDQVISETGKYAASIKELIAIIPELLKKSDPEQQEALRAALQPLEKLGTRLSALRTAANAADQNAAIEHSEQIKIENRRLAEGVQEWIENIYQDRGLLVPAQKSIQDDNAQLNTDIQGILQQSAQAPQAGPEVKEQAELLSKVLVLLEKALNHTMSAGTFLQDEHFLDAVKPQGEAIQAYKDALDLFKDPEQDQDNQDQQDKKQNNQEQQEQDQPEDQQQPEDEQGEPEGEDIEDDQGTQAILEKEQQDRKSEEELEAIRRGMIRSEEKDW